MEDGVYGEGGGRSSVIVSVSGRRVSTSLIPTSAGDSLCRYP